MACEHKQQSKPINTVYRKRKKRKYLKKSCGKQDQKKSKQNNNRKNAWGFENQKQKLLLL